MAKSLILVLVATFFTATLAIANSRNQIQQLNGNVACLDCPAASDLSGIQLLFKCENVRRMSMTYTTKDGSFATGVPSDGPAFGSPSNCKVKISGAPYNVYVSASNSLISFTKKEKEGNLEASKPLTFYKSCPSNGNCEAKDIGFESVDLPRESGSNSDTSYVALVPIVGIP